jgi:hypothetical protein
MFLVTLSLYYSPTFYGGSLRFFLVFTLPSYTRSMNLVDEEVEVCC